MSATGRRRCWWTGMERLSSFGRWKSDSVLSGLRLRSFTYRGLGSHIWLVWTIPIRFIFLFVYSILDSKAAAGIFQHGLTGGTTPASRINQTIKSLKLLEVLLIIRLYHRVASLLLPVACLTLQAIGPAYFDTYRVLSIPTESYRVNLIAAVRCSMLNPDLLSQRLTLETLLKILSLSY